MFLKLRKLCLIFGFNTCLLMILVIGIQNSSNKSKVNLLIDETVNLPIGFILGTSFITGSIVGGLLNISFIDQKK